VTTEVTKKVRERVLDSAEELFSQNGYESVSLREVAEHASVHISQIVYHFTNKNLLVRAIVMRRADELSRERLQMLDYYQRAIGETKPEVNALLRAFLSPFFERRSSGDQGWRNYSTFIGRIIWDPNAAPHINDAFNEVAKAYIKAFCDALPDVPEEKIHWGFQFALASMYSVEETNTRIAGLSDDRYSGKDLEIAFQAIIPFLGAGFSSM
jgi:AcrR family transcriptional regulator